MTQERVWRFSKEWLFTTAIAAIGSTAVDAVLLERKFGLFRGGFLAEGQLRSAQSGTAFVAASLGIDAAACAIPAALALLVTARMGLGPLARIALAGALGVLPTLVTNIVAYEIVSYIGDVANLRILYQLTGQSLQEMLAVGASQGGWLVAAGILVAAVVAGCVYALHRIAPEPGLSMPRVTLRRILFHTFTVLLTGTTLTAAARLSDPAFDLSIARKPTGRFFSWIVQQITDVDGDGFGLLTKPSDPDPWDARVNPYALDLPGDGVDEDGLAGDLPAGGEPYKEGAETPPRWNWKPVFVLAVLETFRADLIGARVGGREITPVLNALAREGMALERAFSHNGFTVQSRYHLFTGSLAGARGRTSLIDDFKQNGYQAAFFSAQDETFGDWFDVGFNRADVRYDARQDIESRFSQFATPGSLGVPASLLRDRVRSFLESRDHSRPLFLTVNLQDTHFPYSHRQVPTLLSDVRVAKGEMREANAEKIRMMYFNTAAYVDRTLGEILADVERTTGQPPVVVALGDHGESLFEEGFLGHGYDTNDAQTRMAFVARGFRARFPEPFGQVDLRDAIWNGLMNGPGQPTRDSVAGKHVTQYVGEYSRPHRIASTSLDHRLTFDFRTRLVRIDEGGWRAVAALSAREFTEWSELVQQWERAMLARAAIAQPEGVNRAGATP